MRRGIALLPAAGEGCPQHPPCFSPTRPAEKIPTARTVLHFSLSLPIAKGLSCSHRNLMARPGGLSGSGLSAPTGRQAFARAAPYPLQQLKSHTCYLHFSLTAGIKAISIKCLMLRLVAEGCVGLLLATYLRDSVRYLKKQRLANYTSSPHHVICCKHGWACFSFKCLGFF